jgi:SprB repeat
LLPNSLTFVTIIDFCIKLLTMIKHRFSNYSTGWLVLVIFFLGCCTNNDINKKFDCATSDLEVALVSKTDASGCKSIDGKLLVSASNGKAPYDYSLNGGTFQTNPEFINLSSGKYTVVVKDANNCEKPIDVDIAAANTTLDASIVVVRNNQCTSPNGSITITGTGGTPPYSYLSGTGTFGAVNTFANLKGGVYNFIVKDATDCQKSLSVTVPRENTGISYSGQIKPIFEAACNFAGCHGAGTSARDWNNFSNVSTQKNAIKTRTGNRSMPIGSGPSLTQTQIDLIACWVDDGGLDN